MFENSLRFLKTAIMELADYLLYVIWNNSINILIDNSYWLSNNKESIDKKTFLTIIEHVLLICTNGTNLQNLITIISHS